MLTIKDLTSSKELDRAALTGVVGGFGYGAAMPAFLLNLASPVNAPKAASLLGAASSFTGPQTNTNLQSDNDFNAVIGSGQVVNTGGNHNSTLQSALSSASNVGTITQ